MGNLNQMQHIKTKYRILICNTTYIFKKYYNKKLKFQQVDLEVELYSRTVNFFKADK